MIFRNLRTKRQLKEFQETATPDAIAEEKVALEREDAEASGGSMATPGSNGVTETLNGSLMGNIQAPNSNASYELHVEHRGSMRWSPNIEIDSPSSHD